MVVDSVIQPGIRLAVDVDVAVPVPVRVLGPCFAVAKVAVPGPIVATAMGLLAVVVPVVAAVVVELLVVVLLLVVLALARVHLAVL